MEKTKTTTKKAIKKETEKKVSAISLETNVYSQKGAVVETLVLPSKIFGLKWNANLVHDVVVSMMSNSRAGIAHTKDRSEVSGGGKKPWKQKGTGKARHGSTRSPIWVGGGVTFGPRNDKDYSKKINKKTKVKALFTMLSQRLANDKVVFVDSIVLAEIKTKEAVAILNTLISKTKSSAKKFIIALPEKDVTIEKSFANIPNVETIATRELSPAILANAKSVIFVNPKATLLALEAKLK